MTAGRRLEKRYLNLLTVLLLLILALTACKQEVTWQEQYDLGMRYLSESNYEEAVAAFTMAIQIDPKQAPAYVGRGNAYVGMTDSTDEEKLTEALADYEQAVTLDEEYVDAYLGMADVYTRQGNLERVLEILRKGWEITKSFLLGDRLSELEAESDPDLLDPAFGEREGYRPFISLLENEQTLIRQVIELLKDNNYVAIKPLVSNAGIAMDLFTMVDGYKLEIAMGQGLSDERVVNKLLDYLPEESDPEDIDINESGGRGIIVQARPMNGEGFLYVYYEKLQTIEGTGEEIDTLNSLLEGTCENWQFNGPISSQWNFFEIETGIESETSMVGTFEIKGVAQNNMLEWQSGHSEEEIGDSTYHTSFQYQRNGDRLDQTITASVFREFDGQVFTYTDTVSSSYRIPVLETW